MKKMIIGAAVAAAGLAALRRFWPAIREGGMEKCHEMMNKCHEMFGQQAGPREDMTRTSAAPPGEGQAAPGEPGQAEAARAS